MRTRWFSRRALGLHLALVCWTPGCLWAGWWQVTRALGGNALSYLYSIEWPAFALVGIWAWWSLVHTDPETVGARAQRRALAAQQAAHHADPAVLVGAAAAEAWEGSSLVAAPPERRRDQEDSELAAYNDRLAALAASGQAKTWRHR